MDEVLTAIEAAERLVASQDTVRRSGRKVWLFSKSELMTFKPPKPGPEAGPRMKGGEK